MRVVLLAWVLAVCPVWAGSEGLPARPLDLTLADDDLTSLAKTLSAALRIDCRVRGDVPERKITLAMKGIPLRNALDGLSRLYGVRWEFVDGGIIFAPDQLARDISLELTNADYSTAMREVSKASRVALPPSPRKSSRKLSLEIADIPARDVVDGLESIYGPSEDPRPLQRPRARFEPVSPDGLPPGSASPSAIITGLVQAGPKEKDARLLELSHQFVRSFSTDDLRSILPGRQIDVALLTPAQRALALEIAQRYAVYAVVDSLNRHGDYLDPVAAMTGNGLKVGRSRDGKWFELTIPDAYGVSTVLTGRSLVPIQPGR
jgi:hypothetical protein